MTFELFVKDIPPQVKESGKVESPTDIQMGNPKPQLRRKSGGFIGLKGVKRTLHKFA